MAVALVSVVLAVVEIHPVVAIIAIVAASYVDNEFIFKEDEVVDTPFDLDLQNTSEGGSAISLIGPECRVVGQIIYLSDPPSGSSKVDIALAFSNDHKSIVRIKRIYAEGYDIFNSDGATNSGVIEQLTLKNVNAFWWPARSQVNKFQATTLTSPVGSFDLTKFRKGHVDVFTMKGWDRNENNWGNNGGGANDPPGTIYVVERLPTGESSITALRFFKDTRTVFRPETAPPAKPILNEFIVEATNPTYAELVRVQSGVAGNDVDPDILAKVAKTPAFEGTGYVVLKNFILARFGNRVPQIVMIAAQSTSTVTLPDAVDLIFNSAGWDRDDSLNWDASSLSADVLIHGYTMKGELSVDARLKPLMYAYDFRYHMRDGTAYFYHLTDARTFEIDESEWGASIDEASDVGIQFTQPTQISQPSKVTVSFVDRLNAWEDSAVERHLSSRAVSADAVEIDLRSLTLDYTSAIEIAERLLWEPHRLGEFWKATLSQKYWFILEGDIIETEFKDRDIDLLVTKKDIGRDNTVRLEGRVHVALPPDSGGL